MTKSLWDMVACHTVTPLEVTASVVAREGVVLQSIIFCMSDVGSDYFQ